MQWFQLLKVFDRSLRIQRLPLTRQKGRMKILRWKYKTWSNTLNYSTKDSMLYAKQKNRQIWKYWNYFRKFLNLPWRTKTFLKSIKDWLAFQEMILLIQKRLSALWTILAKSPWKSVEYPQKHQILTIRIFKFSYRNMNYKWMQQKIWMIMNINEW